MKRVAPEITLEQARSLLRNYLQDDEHFSRYWPIVREYKENETFRLLYGILKEPYPGIPVSTIGDFELMVNQLRNVSFLTNAYGALEERHPFLKRMWDLYIDFKKLADLRTEANIKEYLLARGITLSNEEMAILQGPLSTIAARQSNVEIDSLLRRYNEPEIKHLINSVLVTGIAAKWAENRGTLNKLGIAGKIIGKFKDMAIYIWEKLPISRIAEIIKNEKTIQDMAMAIGAELGADITKITPIVVTVAFIQRLLANDVVSAEEAKGSGINEEAKGSVTNDEIWVRKVLKKLSDACSKVLNNQYFIPGVIAISSLAVMGVNIYNFYSAKEELGRIKSISPRINKTFSELEGKLATIEVPDLVESMGGENILKAQNALNRLADIHSRLAREIEKIAKMKEKADSGFWSSIINTGINAIAAVGGAILSGGAYSCGNMLKATIFGCGAIAGAVGTVYGGFEIYKRLGISEEVCNLQKRAEELWGVLESKLQNLAAQLDRIKTRVPA